MRHENERKKKPNVNHDRAGDYLDNYLITKAMKKGENLWEGNSAKSVASPIRPIGSKNIWPVGEILSF